MNHADLHSVQHDSTYSFSLTRTIMDLFDNLLYMIEIRLNIFNVTCFYFCHDITPFQKTPAESVYCPVKTERRVRQGKTQNHTTTACKIRQVSSDIPKPCLPRQALAP